MPKTVSRARREGNMTTLILRNKDLETELKSVLSHLTLSCTMVLLRDKLLGRNEESGTWQEGVTVRVS